MPASSAASTACACRTDIRLTAGRFPDGAMERDSVPAGAPTSDLGRDVAVARHGPEPSRRREPEVRQVIDGNEPLPMLGVRSAVLAGDGVLPHGDVPISGKSVHDAGMCSDISGHRAGVPIEQRVSISSLSIGGEYAEQVRKPGRVATATVSAKIETQNLIRD